MTQPSEHMDAPPGPGRRRRPRPFDHAIRAIRTPRGGVGFGLLALVCLVALAGPLLAPYSPDALVGAPFAGPSSSHVLGTDTLGRDVLSRTLAGGWVLLIMAAAATALGVALGAVAGVSAGYLRGRADG